MKLQIDSYVNLERKCSTRDETSILMSLLYAWQCDATDGAENCDLFQKNRATVK